MSKYYKKMFETLNGYLKNRIEDIDQTIIEAVNARNNGKCFSFQEHLSSLSTFIKPDICSFVILDLNFTFLLIHSAHSLAIER